LVKIGHCGAEHDRPVIVACNTARPQGAESEQMQRSVLSAIIGLAVAAGFPMPSAKAACTSIQAKCAVQIGGRCDPRTGRWQYGRYVDPKTGPVSLGGTTQAFLACLERTTHRK
jgi:hypothetical protein